jgi:hypothetical protein
MSMAQATLQHEVRNVGRLGKAKIVLTLHSDIIVWIEFIGSSQGLAILVIFTVHLVAILVVKHRSLANDCSLIVLIIGDRLAQYQHTGITFRLGRLLITFL